MADAEQTVTAYKGFDADMKCRGYQFEIGKTYEHDGAVEVCKSGFHACEYPLDVFAYYSPSSSQFARVEQSGELGRHADDSKVASSRITIKASIDLPGLIKAAIEYTTLRADPKKSNHATGDRSASSATGDSSASSATGDSSASSATGYSAASSATGYSSASSATGYRSASSATGDRSASLSTGSYSSSEIVPEDGNQLHAVAIGAGYSNKVRAPLGSAIVCVYRNDDGELAHIRASKVGDNGIKPNTWYSLGADGEFVEVQS